MDWCVIKLGELYVSVSRGFPGFRSTYYVWFRLLVFVDFILWFSGSSRDFFLSWQDVLFLAWFVSASSYFNSSPSFLLLSLSLTIRILVLDLNLGRLCLSIIIFLKRVLMLKCGFNAELVERTACARFNLLFNYFYQNLIVSRLEFVEAILFRD